jgi:hypothetical protein
LQSFAESLAADTSSGNSIPFWIQLLAVILAPGLAFFAVVYGASLSYKHENRKWLRDERQKAYFEFLTAVRHWGRRCRVQISDAFTSDDPSVATAAVESVENDDSYNEVLRRYDLLRLVGGKSVIAASEKTFVLAKKMAEATNSRAEAAQLYINDSNMPYESQEQEWLQLVDSFFDSIDVFVLIANQSLMND